MSGRSRPVLRSTMSTWSLRSLCPFVRESRRSSFATRKAIFWNLYSTSTWPRIGRMSSNGGSSSRPDPEASEACKSVATFYLLVEQEILKISFADSTRPGVCEFTTFTATYWDIPYCRRTQPRLSITLPSTWMGLSGGSCGDLWKEVCYGCDGSARGSVSSAATLVQGASLRRHSDRRRHRCLRRRSGQCRDLNHESGHRRRAVGQGRHCGSLFGAQPVAWQIRRQGRGSRICDLHPKGCGPYGGCPAIAQLQNAAGESKRKHRGEGRGSHCAAGGLNRQRRGQRASGAATAPERPRLDFTRHVAAWSRFGRVRAGQHRWTRPCPPRIWRADDHLGHPPHAK